MIHSQSDRFVAKEVGSDLVCYDAETDEVHILNSTARTVLDLLCAGKTEEQIVEFLKAASSVPEGGEIDADVRACIESLIEKGLVNDSEAR